MIKILTTILAALLLMMIAVFLLYQHTTMLSSDYYLPRHQLDTLWNLGLEALSSQDVPVSSFILYRDSIIGGGYNTVQRDTNAGSHAEINAISDALKRLGISRFARLDKDSLMLVTTFEPCLMCRGAIIEYGIKNVVFLKPKPIAELVRKDFLSLQFLWKRRNAGFTQLQDSLFALHPKYPRNADRH